MTVGSFFFPSILISNPFR